MAIFGVPGDGISTTNKIKNVIPFWTLLARRRILLEWKSAHPSKTSSCMKDLILFLKLEKIKYCIRGPTQKFHDTWAPLLLYFEKLDILPQNWNSSRNKSSCACSSLETQGPQKTCVVIITEGKCQLLGHKTSFCCTLHQSNPILVLSWISTFSLIYLLFYFVMYIIVLLLF